MDDIPRSRELMFAQLEQAPTPKAPEPEPQVSYVPAAAATVDAAPWAGWVSDDEQAPMPAPTAAVHSAAATTPPAAGSFATPTKSVILKLDVEELRALALRLAQEAEAAKQK
jgi:hypothetical protein